jgi:Permuted papain-like amidase enzyme, YaeF/YiiX, C92 family
MSPTPPLALPYAQVRPLIRSGDLLLCSGSSAMSTMIQAATDSPYSHVAFVLRVEALDRVMVLESVESIGIRACTLGSYVRDYNGTMRPYPGRLYLARHAQMDLQAQGPSWQTLSQTALDLLGHPYGTRDILDITARIVAAKLGLPVRPPRTDSTMICSEFVQLVYASIDVHVAFNPLNYIAPADFATCPDVQILWEIVP